MDNYGIYGIFHGITRDYNEQWYLSIVIYNRIIYYNL